MSAYYVSKYTCEEIDALLDGKAVPIKGVYPSLDSLKAEFPNGADGLYQTSDTGNLYVWNAKKQEWESLGNIVGPAGPRGAVIVPSVSPDGVMSFREESGEVTLPEPVNVKGPQGVSVQSARIDESGDLILTLTDAQVINAGRAIGPEGAKGATGASIDRIERTEGTGAPGSIDTYTVYLTNGVTTTFQVYNGKDGDGAGDMTKAVYDPTGKEQDIFAYSVPQTRKINKKPLSADVTLTGEDIPAGAEDEKTLSSHLADLYSALGGKLGAPIAIPSGADLNNCKAPGLYYVGADSIVATIKNTPTQHAFVMLVEKLNDAGDCIQTLKAWSDGSAYRADTYIRSSYPNWGLGWQRLATALPPEEIPLQLAEGFSNSGGASSVYWKDQFSQVHVIISAMTPQIADANTYGYTVAMLPQGFRPTKPYFFNCSFADGNERGSGSKLNVLADGNILYFGNARSAGSLIWGELIFIAA